MKISREELVIRMTAETQYEREILAALRTGVESIRSEDPYSQTNVTTVFILRDPNNWGS